MEVGDAAVARDVEMWSCYAAALRNNRGLCKRGDISKEWIMKTKGRERRGRGGRNDQLMKLQGDERIDPDVSRSVNL